MITRIALRCMPVLLVLTLVCASHAAPAQDSDDSWFQRAEACKATGDWAGMEAALTAALRLGSGGEYQWRSLAWAQALQGKWRESLANARENIRRNGEWAWSLEQLSSSAMAAGDMELARQALERAARLPAERRNCDLAGDWQALRDRIGVRTYEIRWKMDPGQNGDPTKPARILMPKARNRWQTLDYTVENVRSWKRVTEGERELLEVVQKPGEPLVVVAALEHRGVGLGARRLASAPAGPCPAELRRLLGPFRNGQAYDPALPEVAEIVRKLRAPSSAATVQNVLDWLADNMRYEAGHSDELLEILKSHRGVCHHYSNLMVTLCRAAGVPALVAHGFRIPTSGAFTGAEGSHGWVEVYLNGIGWTAVEPLDRNSLRWFGGAGYLFFDTSGHTPTDDHFRYWSAQGCPIDGKVISVRLP